MLDNDLPLITVATVSYNSVSTIEKTILSVINQTYSNIEYILIDGGSDDGTIDIIKKYQKKIAYWISERDTGVYDAMNKAIKVASGEWINFMNSGDCFCDKNTLARVFAKFIPDGTGFLYSDYYGYNWKHKLCRYEAGLGKKINHQSVIYRRQLHQTYGYYLSPKKYIISDYLFFMLVPKEQILKISVPISICSPSGISAGDWCWYQKICLDYFFNNISIVTLIFRLSIQLFKNCIKKIIL
jgi:glycosyltransferase involved in cell wall biosynthesis